MTDCTSIDLIIPWILQSRFSVVWSTPQFKVQVWTWRRPGNEAMAHPYSCATALPLPSNSHATSHVWYM